MPARELRRATMNAVAIASKFHAKIVDTFSEVPGAAGSIEARFAARLRETVADAAVTTLRRALNARFSAFMDDAVLVVQKKRSPIQVRMLRVPRMDRASVIVMTYHGKKKPGAHDWHPICVDGFNAERTAATFTTGNSSVARTSADYETKIELALPLLPDGGGVDIDGAVSARIIE